MIKIFFVGFSVILAMLTSAAFGQPPQNGSVVNQYWQQMMQPTLDFVSTQQQRQNQVQQQQATQTAAQQQQTQQLLQQVAEQTRPRPNATLQTTTQTTTPTTPIQQPETSPWLKENPWGQTHINPYAAQPGQTPQQTGTSTSTPTQPNIYSPTTPTLPPTKENTSSIYD